MTVVVETELGWRFGLWSSEAREGWSATRGDQTEGGVGLFL